MRILLVMVACLGASACVSTAPLKFTCGDRFARHTSAYPDLPLVAEIHRDARDFDAPDTQPVFFEMEGGAFDDGQPAMFVPTEASLALRDAVESADKATPGDDGESRIERPYGLLFLSGGGQWGAFGAGFLNAWHADKQAFPRITAITAISTGAMQSLFVAAGEYDGLVDAYTITDQSQIARGRGLVGLFRRGSLFDTASLRERIESTLCPSSEGGGRCPMLEAIAAEGSPHLLIGMVEAKSGNLLVTDVTAMVRDHYTQRDGSDRDLAQCVTGVAMASSAVPGQLSPVQIDGTTYVDGGVRSSVFAKLVGGSAMAARVAHKPKIWVIRNGPTIVAPDEGAKGDPALARVDADPSVINVGKRSYSTIVNQNEVNSIALLRQIYPREDMSLATADGYLSLNPQAPRCQRDAGQEDRVFDPGFMACLVEWGRTKYVSPGWITLSPPQPEK